MPSVTAECGYCGMEFDATMIGLDDLFSRCTECTNDVCRNCGVVEAGIHRSCNEILAKAEAV